MKQIKFFWFALAAVFSFAACSRADGSEISVPPDSSQYGTEADVEDPADEIPLEVPAKVPLEAPDSEGEGTGDNDIPVAPFSWADNALRAADVDAVSSPSVLPPGKCTAAGRLGTGRNGRRPVLNKSRGALSQ